MMLKKLRSFRAFGHGMARSQASVSEIVSINQAYFGKKKAPEQLAKCPGLEKKTIGLATFVTQL
jgi:hypothetical protein